MECDNETATQSNDEDRDKVIKEVPYGTSTKVKSQPEEHPVSHTEHQNYFIMESVDKCLEHQYCDKDCETQIEEDPLYLDTLAEVKTELEGPTVEDTESQNEVTSFSSDADKCKKSIVTHGDHEMEIENLEIKGESVHMKKISTKVETEVEVPAVEFTESQSDVITFSLEAKEINKRSVMHIDSHGIEIKIEIKEEPEWVERAAAVEKCEREIAFDSVTDFRNVLKDSTSCVTEMLPTDLSRLHTEETCRDSSNISSFLSSPSLENWKIDGSTSKTPSICEVCGEKVFKKHLYKCDNCEKFCTPSSNLKQHQQLIQGPKMTRSSSISNNSFTKESNLKQHHLVHEDERPHKCEVCEKSFPRLSTLKRHYLIHEGKKPYKCEICEKNFPRASTLKRHYLIHEGKRPYKCDVCEKTFILSSHLKAHLLIHEGKRPYKCDICDKNFPLASTLKRHNFIHEGKRPYKCDVCEKGFTRTSQLKQHHLVHEGKRLYKCGICDKSYTCISPLKVHQLIHEGKMPYKCDVCEKRFTHGSTFKRHKLIHEGKRPHKCEVCGRAFTQASNLKQHQLIHEPKIPRKCAVCDKIFSHAYTLKRHQLIHEGARIPECDNML